MQVTVDSIPPTAPGGTARPIEPGTPAPENARSKTIERRRQGRLGRSISALGLGGAGLHASCGILNTDATAIATVHAAVDAGINYFDTSPGYGESERRLGLALRGYPREQLVIATKAGTGAPIRNYSRDFALRSVETSLQRLGTDYLDLVQIHDPDSYEDAFSPDGILGALVSLKEQGVIRGIGIGVRSHELLLHAIRDGAFDSILTYADFNILYQSARDNLFQPARDHDVAVVLGSPLFFGYLSDEPWEQVIRGRRTDGTSDEEKWVLRARHWAESHQLSKVHLSLQYCLREPRISTVLTGASTPQQVRQSIAAATTPLPDWVWTALADELDVR